MSEPDALAKAIRLSAWEAANASCHIGLAIFQATLSQPGIDKENFTQSVLYYLRQVEASSDSDIVVNAVQLMADAITNVSNAQPSDT